MRLSHRAALVVVFVASVVVTSQPVTVAAAGTVLPVAAVSASADDGNVPANTLDNNLSTRWSAEGDGVWIQYDLGSSKTVGSVSIAWHQGNVRTSSFEVRVSGDENTWTTIVPRNNSSGTTLQPQNHDFTDRSARYLRIVGYGNTVNDWTSITETTIHGTDGGGGSTCDYPADVLDLTNWYIGLPIGEAEKPKNVYQPELATFAVDPWFVATPECDAVRFRAAVNGVTTTGSSNPRSELRERTNNGTEMASWSSTSGTHTMVIDQAITAVPKERPYIVAGQIHGGSDDISVFRLEGTRLYVTEGDNGRHLVTDNYMIGDRFQAKFVVSDGQIKAYYNGVLKTTISEDFDTGYFKAGAYTQANCTNSKPCSNDNYGEVKIYGLTVTHDER